MVSRATILVSLLTLVLGLGAGAYGFRLYLGSLQFTDLSGDPQSLLTVDHGQFQDLLDAHLKTDFDDGIHRFDYRAALADKAQLAAYLAGLQAIDPAALGTDEALAYWLNFYNAGMIHLILTRGEFGRVIDQQAYYFLTDHFTVADQGVSLDKIENQIIRQQWAEPRIHYGLNCASLSCPNLQPRVFMGATLEAQLDAAARAYINHPRGVEGLQGRRLVVSEIFDWFADDFGGTDAATLAHLATYAEADLSPARRLRFLPYDWTLNIIPE